ncbi:MAG: cbb3-type cytochrome c oxidase subunit I [Chloroflexi bacterium]|nr:cbb3-type cytochrome c oxidase subunit I [Chloroflexota bacterium]
MLKGVIAGLAGTAVGMALTMVVRSALGYPAWQPDQVTLAGTLVGIPAYLAGVGAFSAWWGWVLGKGIEEPGGHHFWGWTRYFGADPNHKVIGIQYMATSLVVIAVAGIYQLIARLETSQPGLQFLSPDTYNSLMSLHGIMMLGAVLLGVSGMINYLVPLMIGARDMAFPRLNAFSYWITVPAVFLLLFALPAGGFDTGWTGYPPLSTKAPLGMQLMILAFYLVGWSSILGGVNFLATIMKMRAPGMGLFRMPIFVWTALATAFLQIVFTQFVGIAFLMVLLQRVLGLGFFDPAKGGNVLLFQHLFWLYSHPAVYIFVLPGLGVISEIVPVFSRKPLFGYRLVALSSFGIALQGAIVWGHHMFTAGIEEWLRIPFMVTTMLVAVPTGVKIFSWLATMWHGKISLDTPMLFALTAIAVFLVGGLTGIPNGIVPTDLYIHDTYWVVAHFHHTLFGGFVFPAMAAIYFWFPKVTGRLLNRGLGKLHWALMTVGFFVTYEPMFWLGLNGMRRRIADYDPALGLGPMNTVVSVAAYVIALSMLVFFVNLVASAWRGTRAPANPWRSRTLEWQLSSPPPEHNFPTPPQVLGSPYGFGIPGSVHAVVTPAGGAGEEKGGLGRVSSG